MFFVRGVMAGQLQAECSLEQISRQRSPRLELASMLRLCRSMCGLAAHG